MIHKRNYFLRDEESRDEGWHCGCRACMLITAIVILATILLVQYGFGEFPR